MSTDEALRKKPMMPIDFYRMSEPELLAYCGQNAAKWAEAFCAIKEVAGWGLKDIDEALMTGWFANAIEHSHSGMNENAMSIFDKFYAGERSYSIPFICALAIIVAMIIVSR